MDRREHHRVQLRMPARLRWMTPFGQMTEVCETVNVSRSGLLVPCRENHAAGVSLWVTFPYDASLPSGQPEVLARVVRSERAGSTVLLEDGREALSADIDGDRGSIRFATHNRSRNGSTDGPSHSALDGSHNGGSNGTHAYAASTALRLEIAAHPSSSGNGDREAERRASPRRLLAIPIRVRPENVPWFEETMTMDVSREGLRFLSCRLYEPGHRLIISFEDATASPWPTAAEVPSLVQRVGAIPKSPAMAVAISRIG